MSSFNVGDQSLLQRMLTIGKDQLVSRLKRLELTNKENLLFFVCSEAVKSKLVKLVLLHPTVSVLWLFFRHSCYLRSRRAFENIRYPSLHFMEKKKTRFNVGGRSLFFQHSCLRSRRAFGILRYPRHDWVNFAWSNVNSVPKISGKEK